MKQSQKMICVAAAAGAFGVKGEIRLKSFTAAPRGCLAYGPLYSEAGDIVLTPKFRRVMKDFIVVTAPEVSNREAAEALKSTKLFVPRHNLPQPDEDEFYFTDLIGLEVKTADGQRVGQVLAIYEFGAGDMLEIKPKDEPSFFHPFTKTAVPKVDIAAERIIIVIDPPE